MKDYAEIIGRSVVDYWQLRSYLCDKINHIVIRLL